MPLSKGCTTKARNENVKKLIEEGFPSRQAYAIAMSMQQKACGIAFFNYGLLSERDLKRIVGDQEVAVAGGQNYALGFFGPKHRPGLIRAKGDTALGYTVSVTEDELDAIHAKLGGKRAYARRSVSVRNDGRTAYPAQTFVPVAKSRVEPTQADLMRVARSLASVIGHAIG